MHLDCEIHALSVCERAFDSNRAQILNFIAMITTISEFKKELRTYKNICVDELNIKNPCATYYFRLFRMGIIKELCNNNYYAIIRLKFPFEHQK